jgi:predicted peptidase
MSPLLFLLGSCAVLSADTGFLDRSLSLNQLTHNYQVYIPRDYDSTKPWPVILFLHGVGQRGADGLQPSAIALPHAIRTYPDRYPAIVVIPQTKVVWFGPAIDVALAALDATMREFNADPARIHLTGISMGGLGAYMTLMAAPHRFASLSVLCSAFEIPTGPLPPDLQSLATTVKLPSMEQLASAIPKLLPIRIYAGGKDKLVPPASVLRTVEALRQSGHSIDYIEFPNASHNVWDPVYLDKDFPAWLFQQQLKPNPAQ